MQLVTTIILIHAIHYVPFLLSFPLTTFSGGPKGSMSTGEGGGGGGGRSLAFETLQDLSLLNFLFCAVELF